MIKGFALIPEPEKQFLDAAQKLLKLDVYLDDLDFLGPILENPKDQFPRLVWADWLDEQGDSRGEILRLDAQINECIYEQDRFWPFVCTHCRPIAQRRIRLAVERECHQCEVCKGTGTNKDKLYLLGEREPELVASDCQCIRMGII